VKRMKKWNLEPNRPRRMKWLIDPDEAVGRMQSDWRGTWLVLRCANKNTLPLVVALETVGLRAWTPLWVRRRRYPRSSNARKVLLPCLPSFVFLAEGDILGALAAAEGNGVPGFSIMNSYGVLVRIADGALEGLRKITDLSPRKVNPVNWPAVGDAKAILSGAFQGLVGTVVGLTERHCLVKIEGSSIPPLKIPPFLLTDIEA